MYKLCYYLEKATNYGACAYCLRGIKDISKIKHTKNAGWCLKRFHALKGNELIALDNDLKDYIEFTNEQWERLITMVIDEKFNEVR